ncbi:MAG: pentapeptide repeat-containing protein, partial [Cyanobacteria bacterium J06632_22]
LTGLCDRTPWYDRMAGTQVIGTGVGDVRQTYQVAPEDIFEPAPLALRPRFTQPTLYGAELFGVPDDDQVSVSHDVGGLSSLVLSPLDSAPLPVVPAPSRRFFLRPLSLVGLGGLVVGSVWGTQTYIQAQVDQRLGDWPSDQQFLTAVQTLIATPENTTEYRAAILALARISDPRAVEYLADLLTQTDDPEILSTLEQALASQGLAALPTLRQLSLTLNSDLVLDPADDQGSIRRQQQATQQAITKILHLNDGDLAGATFDKVDLSYRATAPAPFRLRLNDIDAAGTQWRGAGLAQANLSGSRFAAVGADGQWGTVDDVVSDFSGADLKEADLSRADLRSTQLVRTSLLRARLSQGDLREADLSYSNLSSADLLEVNASSSRWVESKLVGADLTRAIFGQADLTQAQLSQAAAVDTQWQQANLSGTQWHGADLSGADFTQANLRQAILTESRVRDADFSGADLSGASLRDADLMGVTLSGANLEGVDFAGARFTEGPAIAANSFITEAEAIESNDRLKGVDFSRSRNLDGRQLTYICSQGGLHPSCRRL